MLRCLLAVFVVLCAGPGVHAAQTVTTNLNSPQQVIEGWGTSLAHFQAGARTIYETDAFRNAFRDLGLNILRVDMQKEVLVASPTDFATEVTLGNDMAGNLALMNFTDSRIATYGGMIQWLSVNALEPDRVKLTGSLWTPPHWMKGPTGATQNWIGQTPNHPTPFLSGQVVNPSNPVNNGDSVGGRLKTEDPHILDQYGKYIASWVKGFEQQYGVPFHSISLQNESTFENPFNSMTFISNGVNSTPDFTQYAKALKSVKTAWEQFGLDTKVMGPHVAWFGLSPANPTGLRATNEMIKGVKNFAADPTLIDFLDYYNANYYQGTNEAGVKTAAAFWAGSSVATGEWTGNHTPPGVMNDGKAIWFTESSGENPTNWTSSILVALKMHNALVYDQASAYLYWQLLDAGNISQYTLLQQSQLANPTSSKKYSAFKQFSGFVRPGAIRVDATFTNGAASVGGNSKYDTDDSLNVSAFYHPEDRRLTYVLINMLDDPEAVTLVLPQGLNLTTLKVFRTSATESFASLADLVVVDGKITYTAPSFTVTTITSLIDLLLGDANRDGVVDTKDVLAVERYFGATGLAGGAVLGDANFDGRVDGLDYTTVEQQINGGGSGGGGAAPEPLSGAMLSPAALLLCGRRRGARG